MREGVDEVSLPKVLNVLAVHVPKPLRQSSEEFLAGAPPERHIPRNGPLKLLDLLAVD